MSIAVECQNGHKRSVRENFLEKITDCPEPNCGSIIQVPGISSKPSYKTDRLEIYNSKFLSLADQLYEILYKDILYFVKKLKGSYSIIATTSKETAGKIIIYQDGIGTMSREDFPSLADGVYILVRANDKCAGKIWNRDMVDDKYPQLFSLMSPNKTLGIAPKREERFTYFHLKEDSSKRYLMQVAALLIDCSKA